jgi:hypothetical protein
MGVKAAYKCCPGVDCPIAKAEEIAATDVFIEPEAALDDPKDMLPAKRGSLDDVQTAKGFVRGPKRKLWRLRRACLWSEPGKILVKPPDSGTALATVDHDAGPIQRIERLLNRTVDVTQR